MLTRTIMIFILGIVPLCGAMDKAFNVINKATNEKFSEVIMVAHKDPTNLLSITFVYEYDLNENAFLKKGDLTSLTNQQVQQVAEGSFYFKSCIGMHRTRLSPEPKNVGALVLGGHPDLEEIFDSAYHLHTMQFMQLADAMPESTYMCDVVNFDRLECNSYARTVEDVSLHHV